MNEHVTTPELAEGDTICHYGARILLVKELVRRPCTEGSFGQGHCDHEQGHGELVCLLGVITNADDPDVDAGLRNLAAGERAHRVRNGRWVPEGDELLWVVQGNALARWSRIPA